MVSEMEQTIRDLDDESLPASKSSRIISAKLGSDFITTRAYIYAKRKGFSSFHTMKVCYKMKKEDESNNDNLLYFSPSELDKIMREESRDLHGYEEDDLEAFLKRILSQMPKQTRGILKDRYYHGRTLTYCSKKYEISRERVRRIEINALRDMHKIIIQEEEGLAKQEAA